MGSDLDTLYSEIILDHYRAPHGAGLREPFDGESHQVNPLCGDEITLRVSLGPQAAANGNGESERLITDVSYQATGCSISQASASMLHDLVAGQTVARASERLAGVRDMLLDPGTREPDEDLLEDAVAVAGVARFPMRVKCALLPWAAFTDAMTRAGASVRRDDAAGAGTTTDEEKR
jgi:nitrogen fixation NifU-like protein